MPLECQLSNLSLPLQRLASGSIKDAQPCSSVGVHVPDAPKAPTVRSRGQALPRPIKSTVRLAANMHRQAYDAIRRLRDCGVASKALEDVALAWNEQPLVH